jgi:hypothetical protein
VPYKEGIIQSIRVPSERFRRVIRKTAPDFKPYSELTDIGYRTAEPEFLKHEENEDSTLDDDDGTYSGLPIEIVESIYVDEVHTRMTE